MVDKYKLHFQRLIPLSVQLSFYIELMDQHKTMIQEPIVKKEGKVIVSKLKKAGFRIRIFFLADPDPDKNFHADPDPGGIRGRGRGVKGKMNFFLSFFHVSDDS